jgi:uncharacterized protein (DUF305 family)
MQNNHENMSNMAQKHYRNLPIMAILSFVSMYILMYAMVNATENVFNNINEFYMAGLMTAPMIPIELLLMRSMYTNRNLNILIVITSIIAGLAFFFLIRQQGAVSDQQFLRSMIPHHGGAILMCEQAPVQDVEITALCETIISSQQAEIDQMKAILQRLEQ